MGKYSRTAKYEELRNQLQNEVEEKSVPNDLSSFANRLNKIDEEEFQEVEIRTETKEPARVRPNIWMEDFFSADEEEMIEDDFQFNELEQNIQQRDDLQRENERAFENTQKMAVFDNEYLDEYLLDEVKSYNRDQGITTEEQLQEKLLREIRGEEEIVRSEKSSSRMPAERALIETATLERWSDIEEEIPLRDENKTFENVSMETKVIPNVMFDDSDESEFQLSGENQFVAPKGNFENELEKERTAREKLIQETTQIKMELDEYKENLNEMEEKFDNSNRMLNFILIVFILICVVVVGVAVYWILLNRGII